MPDDHALGIAAFREVRRLADVNGDLTSRDLRAGFRFEGERIPWRSFSAPGCAACERLSRAHQPGRPSPQTLPLTIGLAKDRMILLDALRKSATSPTTKASR